MVRDAAQSRWRWKCGQALVEYALILQLCCSRFLGYFLSGAGQRGLGSTSSSSTVIDPSTGDGTDGRPRFQWPTSCSAMSARCWRTITVHGSSVLREVMSPAAGSSVLDRRAIQAGGGRRRTLVRRAAITSGIGQTDELRPASDNRPSWLDATPRQPYVWWRSRSSSDCPPGQAPVRDAYPLAADVGSLLHPTRTTHP